MIKMYSGEMDNVNFYHFPPSRGRMAGWLESGRSESRRRYGNEAKQAKNAVQKEKFRFSTGIKDDK